MFYIGVPIFGESIIQDPSENYNVSAESIFGDCRRVCNRDPIGNASAWNALVTACVALP